MPRRKAAPKPDRLAYRVTEAAAALGLSRWTVDRLIRDGELEAVKIPGGQGVLIPAASLARFMAENATGYERPPAEKAAQ